MKKRLKPGIEVQLTVTARILEVDKSGDNAKLDIYADERNWFDTDRLDPLEEVLERRRQVKGVFEATNAIDAGKLPTRKDAVEYIKYLRSLIDVTIEMCLERERELEARGWKRPDWNITSNKATWTMV